MRSLLSLSLLLGVAALPAQDRDFGVSVTTTLTDVRAEPEAFKNVKVVFTAQFASLGRISNPFFTKFTPTDFANFYVWADEQPIWQQGQYEDVFGMLFLGKTHAQLEELYKLGIFDRIKITGVVRNTFQNTPWIEVTEFEPVSGKLSSAVLTHLYRGEKFMSQRQWQRAIAELSRAPGAGVPGHALLAANRNLGVCMLRLGDPQKAIPYLQAASALGGGTEIASLLEMATGSPEAAIDRTVDTRGLKDSERPMWEAFEGDKAASKPAGKPMR